MNEKVNKRENHVTVTLQTDNTASQPGSHPTKECNADGFSELRYRDILLGMDTGVIVYAPDSSVCFCNPGAARLFGLAAEKMLGCLSSDPVWQFIRESDQPLSINEHPVNQILTGRKPIRNYQIGVIRPHQEGPVWLLANGSPVWNSNQEISEIQISYTDITERICSNRELHVSHDYSERKKLQEDLIAARDMAERSNQLNSTFLSNISHEIRTPMNGILGFAELLKESDLTGDEQQEYIRYIEVSGARMLNIINEIVDISRIEAGMVMVEKKVILINKQLEQLSAQFKAEADIKGLKISVNHGLPLHEAVVHTDQGKLVAILSHLVRNAIKYTTSGGVEIGYRLRTEKNLSMLLFFVRDTGIGIKEENREMIFEKFRHGIGSGHQNYEGAGLGLAIAKAYVEMLGGRIWVESKPSSGSGEEEVHQAKQPDPTVFGGGSIFYFTIPFHDDPAIEHQPIDKTVAGKQKKESVPAVTPLKILIAEDEELSAMFLDRAVRIYGDDIRIARNGIEAVEMCRNNPDLDLVLMDIQMPEMSGYQATRQIRRFNKKVTIIAQTAYALTVDRDKALDAGCNDHIAKPVNINELMAVINLHLKTGKGEMRDET